MARVKGNTPFTAENVKSKWHKVSWFCEEGSLQGLSGDHEQWRQL